MWVPGPHAVATLAIVAAVTYIRRDRMAISSSCDGR
jgi:hypothetical protein